MSQQTYCVNCGWRIENGSCHNCGTKEKRPAATGRDGKDKK